MDNRKPRSTIRAGGSVSGATGKTSRFIKRWTHDNAPPNTTLARLEEAYWVGLDTVDRVEARAMTNKTNGKFTRDGARADLLDYALHALVPDLHKAGTTIRAAKAEVADRKSKLLLDAPDKTDVAAALRRMEIRTLIRDKNNEDQAKYFSDHGNKLPAEVTMAVLEMPPEFSGLPKARYDFVAQNALSVRHGPEMAEIAEIENAVTVVEDVLEAARDEVSPNNS